MRRRVSGSDIFSSAYWRTFRALKQGVLESTGSQGFERFLIHAMEQRVLQESRDMKADKRAVEKEVYFDDAEEPASRDPAPEEVAVMKEIIDYLFAGLDDERRLILGLRLDGATYAEILAKLRNTFPDRKPPSEWEVEDCIRHARKKVRRKFFPEGDL
jgi:hypothetical protein